MSQLVAAGSCIHPLLTWYKARQIILACLGRIFAVLSEVAGRKFGGVMLKEALH